MVAFEETVRTLVRARHPIIWVCTAEEVRALQTAEAVARSPRGTTEDPAKTLYCWASSTGVQKIENGKATATIPETNDPLVALDFIAADKAPNGGIYVLRDLHRFLGEQNPTYRYLRDLAAALKTTKKTIIVTSTSSRIPAELEKEIVLVDMPLPTFEELGARLDAVLASWETDSRIAKLENGEREKVIRAGLGLTTDEFESACLESVVQVHKVDPHIVVQAKSQIVRKAGIEFADTSEGMADVGGLANLKRYVQTKASGFTTKGVKFGCRPIRGLFLTGPPGTGKSLSARACANYLGFPILKVSAETIFGRYVGESEANLSRVLKTAEAVAPCLLYVDEAEKFSAGMGGGGDNDSGTSRRVFGQLLSWMQDHVAPVLLVATANDPLQIRPELMGRFDETFFVDMPDSQERREIFSIHLQKKGRGGLWGEFTGAVLDATEGFSGREIERVVNEALYIAFADGERPLTVADLISAAQRIRPLSISRKAEIEQMRKWARENAESASDHTVATPSPITSAAEV